MIVTFRYVPVKFQVLVINVIGVAWQTFLAYAANNAHTSEKVETVKGGVSLGDCYVIGDGKHSRNDNGRTNNNSDDKDDRVKNDVSAGVVVEDKKMVPFVLSTDFRQDTPKSSDHSDSDNDDDCR